MAELLDVLREALAGRYDVQRELGRGGMATVFLAEDVRHRRPVAIKVLHPELASAMGADRFLREIEIAARLQHPHILPLYDSGAAGDHLFFVMPFVEGESLRDRLTREKQLSLEDALKIAGEVASALSYAHSHGVVHRDIKPENILLSGGTAVVADFGIARAVTVSSGDQQLTQTGTVIGTPAYMSPEQATGSPDIDGRSDQYSLACVVYEMLVAEPPFTGPTPQAVMARHSLDMVSPPTIVRGTIPDAVEDALLRALAKVPADRFATCTLFAEALLRPSAITGPMRRRPTGAVLTRKRWGRRAALGAIPLVVIAGGWALFSGGGRSGGAAPEAGLARRIAVLYFEDRSPGKTLSYLADGLTEALIRELSDVKVLQVISRNGVAQFKGARVAPDSIGRALNVGTIVDGTIEQAGDSLRLTVELTNAANGDVTGTTRLTYPRSDVFGLQDTLARALSVFLRRRVGEEVQQIQTRSETRDATAWELVQRAQQMADQAGAAEDIPSASRVLSQADSLLARAEGLDRRWATPIIRRGWVAYRQSRLPGASDRDFSAPWIREGLAHAERALALKPQDPDALELRGTLRYWRYLLSLETDPAAAERLRDQAEQDLRAATQANPNQASAWTSLTHLLLNKSATSDAYLAALNAYNADPYLTSANTTVWRLFSAALDLENSVNAVHWCEEGQRRFADDPHFTECQLLVFALKGQRPDIARAWRLLDQMVAFYQPDEREFQLREGGMYVAMALVRAGLPDSARRVAERSRADASVDPTRDVAYLEAAVRTMLGDKAEAIRQLSAYLAANPQQRGPMARDESWWFRDLKGDPRFQSLVGGAGAAR